MDGSAKVLIHSSVWIDFFRGTEPAASAMRTVIQTKRVVVCGQIKQEVLQGSRDRRAFQKLAREMSLWEYESETPDDFIDAARIFSELRWKG